MFRISTVPAGEVAIFCHRVKKNDHCLILPCDEDMKYFFLPQRTYEPWKREAREASDVFSGTHVEG